ncbi:hypothetical protein [Chromohalobacter sp. 296-RDG]|uniref:hypothetical protein n=1 Tax=Chromohalobacter sp. 296-RDG TaxID=2994062 RepID=UPI0024688B37|nr:hypothetical protein [Chromohalobacter sp. 296-RDG]
MAWRFGKQYAVSGDVCQRLGRPEAFMMASFSLNPERLPLREAAKALRAMLGAS